jgi:amidase
VEDAALFLDVTTTLPAPDGGFVAAASRAPGRLRIALSAKMPPPLTAPIAKPHRAALEEAGTLLRELGHEVMRRDPDYPVAATLANYIPRWARGVHDDLAALPHPELVEARTRTMARLGALFSDRRMEAVHAGEAAIAKRILSIFDDVDVVITPGTTTGPSRIGAYQRRGAIATALLVGMHVPYQEVFNVTGQPAAVVPWGLDEDGLPLSVQLVGRPSDEATLLSLSSQIEATRPWAHRRPPVS